jgi:poly(3-hydroxybutyrate) depolymerase
MKTLYVILVILIMSPIFLIAQTSSCTLPGDTDGSGVIDIVDALTIAQAYVGLNPANYNADCGDVNCNDSIDITDALLIAQLYVGLISDFPCQATPAPTQASTPGPNESVFIACGSSSAVGSYQADEYYSGGSTYENTNTIDVSQVTIDSPPAALFNNERYGDITYTIPGFTPGGTYTVILYFAETYLSSPGERVFNVSINDTTVLSNFDIYAAAGGQNLAIAQWFETTPDSSGQIVIQLTTLTENPKINGISIQPGTAPTPGPTAVSTAVPTTDPSCSTCSEGCGKDLTDLTSGTYTINSAGLSREYIISIPQNYDKNKPYRLIFGMHCMGSSDTGVVSSNYYGLKTYAANDNVPVIFVAPQGYTDSMPWRSDNKDHIFFNDMLNLFKSKLCVDTSRIFSCGFSFGAMFTYSLSLAYQDDLRAVAVYAPANYNIYIPTNTHKPIAYYQTTGTQDGTCPWVNSDSTQTGGKYCLLGHIQDNGCTVPSNIPLATGGTHVTTEFSGCNPGYPVVFGSFVGGHTDTVNENGVNWIAKETWDFFMRF